MAQKRIGVLTCGGDCPGLNAVIRAVVHAGAKIDREVVGFKDGFEGLLQPPNYDMLNLRDTDDIMHLGGTILGTTNRGHFVTKIGKGGKLSLAPELIEQTKKTLKDLDIEGIIVIGGDGSLTTAYELHQNGVKAIGVPKTIDNDLSATAITFGFDSAVSVVVDALDRLRTTATSHKRVMVVEVMGRYAGWIALHGGLAGGADIILVPELPFSFEQITDVINTRENENLTTSMVVVAEGAFAKDTDVVVKKDVGSQGEHKLGGIGQRVADHIGSTTGKDTRCVVLGHLQRGGAPTSLDRILGTRFGVGAVELVNNDLWGHMVSYQNYIVGHVHFQEAISRIKKVTPENQMVGMCREVGINFCDNLEIVQAH
ncbi:MAG: ATP-dependent 6-phosphofructokinase [Verrucomicrobiota bacterium]